MRLVVSIALLAVAACGPGPLPTVARSIDRGDQNLYRDGFPTDSLNDFFPLDHAIRSNRIDELRRLLAEGENPNLRWGQTGDHFPLQEVVDTGGYRLSDPTEAMRLLLAHGADANAKWCPFESRGQYEGAPSCTSARGTTALIFAAASGRWTDVELLLRAGADARTRDWLGTSALDVASNEIAFELISRSLFPAVESRDSNSLKWLQGNGGSRVDGGLFVRALESSGWYRVPLPPVLLSASGAARTAESYQAFYEDLGVQRIRILLRIGANPNQRVDLPDVEWTPLGIAVRHGFVRGAAVLLKGGAGVNERGCVAAGYDRSGKRPIISADCKRDNGMTPLMWAASVGNVDCVALLLEFNADRSLKDWAGRSALDYTKTDDIRKLLATGR